MYYKIISIPLFIQGDISVYTDKWLEKTYSPFLTMYDKIGADDLFRRDINMLPEQSIEFRYDTQLLIEGEDLDEDAINDYITENFVGDSLLAVGDEELIKIHYHTNEPWKVLEYCRSLGEIYDIVVEDMDRQARGLQG